MKKQNKKNSILSFLVVFIFIFFYNSNLVKVNATTLSAPKQVITVSGSTSSNSTITVVGDASKLYSGESYSVSSVADFETQLAAAIGNGDDSVTLTYTGSTAFTSFPTSLNSIVSEATQTAGNDYEKVLLKSWTCSYTTPANPGFTVTYNFTYWETPDQTSQVTTKVNSIISSIITPGMTDVQKEKAINDYICLNVAYDTTLTQHSAYAALFGNKTTVCQGYALLTYKMLTTAGLNARIVVGTAHGEGHAWNMVEINDANGNNPTWYDLDVTWDDPVPDVIGRIRYDYFNLQDSKMISSGHSWTASYYPVADTPFVTTDPDILSGGRSADVISTAPDANNVTIVNNIGAADTITVTGLSSGDVVNVYQDNSTSTVTATGKVATGKTSITLSVAQLGQTAGTIYVSVKSTGAFESTRTAVNYAGEPVSVTPTATVTNNVDIADTVTFKNLSAKDVATVYAKDGTTKLGTATAKTAGDLTITLAKQLSESDLEIQVTVKSTNKLVSPETIVTYTAEAQTTAPLGLDKLNSDGSTTPGDTVVTNNVTKADTVTVKNLKAKDSVTIYASDGTTKLGTATAGTDGTATVTLAKQLDETNRKIFETVKTTNELVSAPTELDYAAETQTATISSTNVFVTNNAVIVVGLNAGDKVSVYDSNTSGAKAIATGTVAKGNTYVVITYSTKNTSLYITNKTNNETESVQLTESVPQ
jgi:hypothetical protein